MYCRTSVAMIGWVIGTFFVIPIQGQDKVADVARLIGQLSDSNFHQRQNAMRDLTELGLVALPSLTAALCDSNPEIRWRAAKTLEDIGLSGDERTLRKVTRIMYLLGNKGLAGLANKSFQMRELWLESQVQRTTQKLTQLGAIVDVVNGYQNDLDVGFAVPMIDMRELAPDSSAAEGPEVEIASAEDSPSLNDADIADLQLAINEIISADESDDDRALAEIQARVPARKPPPESDELDRSVWVEPAEINLAQFRNVTINADWKGTAQDFELLSRVNRLSRLNFSSRKIDAQQWKTAAAIVSLRYLFVDRCDYNVASALEFRQQRQDVYVRVVGRGFLGVMGPLDNSEEACVISQVLPNTGAAQAGLSVDDTITEINGISVKSFQELVLIVGSLQPGDEIKLTYRRDGQLHDTTAKLQSRNAMD